VGALTSHPECSIARRIERRLAGLSKLRGKYSALLPQAIIPPRLILNVLFFSLCRPDTSLKKRPKPLLRREEPERMGLSQELWRGELARAAPENI
jgi:hypothetical protein